MLTACETYTEGIHPAVNMPRLSKIKFLSMPVSALKVTDWKRYLWAKMVEQYSRGMLSVASDKLIAPSGLAREIQKLDGPDIVSVCGLEICQRT